MPKSLVFNFVEASCAIKALTYVSAEFKGRVTVQSYAETAYGITSRAEQSSGAGKSKKDFKKSKRVLVCRGISLYFRLDI